ncbi:MAG: hypothetical protein AB2689_11140 [Candidatus Thiodiazotropha taylori]|nr:hypothetical protein [Candidatus Thiodiazotropha taylori]MCW4316760.1 hypothetical protein [Candidatus Thiodiazotropha taylori]
MKNSLLIAALMLLSTSSNAHAKSIDVVDTWSLNLPTKECFRDFDEYHHKATGWIYYGARIECVTLKAFIHYDRRIHESDTA